MDAGIKLSVALTIFNSEEVIARTINSIYEWADEIIIVDGTSTDNTVNILRELDSGHKITIYTEKNEANFIANKQKAIERCNGTWILELDDDEVVTPELRSEITEKLAQTNNNPALIAFWIPRLNHFLGKPLRKGGQYPDYTIRLYKRGHARFPVKSIHDQVEIDGEPTTKGNFHTNDKLGKLNNPLLHYPYKNIGVFFRKWSQYAMFEGDEQYKKGTRPSIGLFVTHIIWKPLYWFMLTYFRHKGFQDGLAGFFFSLLSGLRFWVEYLRIVELSSK
jgi:glycosyltransferase involved in cell wall biosynthesis